MATNLTWEDVQRIHAYSERLTAELRAAVAPQGSTLIREYDACIEAERAYAAAPDRDDLQADAKAARAKLDTARSEFDKAVAAAKATRTKALDAAMK